MFPPCLLSLGFYVWVNHVAGRERERERDREAMGIGQHVCNPVSDRVVVGMSSRLERDSCMRG